MKVKTQNFGTLVTNRAGEDNRKGMAPKVNEGELASKMAPKLSVQAYKSLYGVHKHYLTCSH